MKDEIFEKIKRNSRLPDQGLEVGDVVYSEYYNVVGRISRTSEVQEIIDNPRYVLSEVHNPEKEICFGVREHMWTHVEGGLKYSRLVKLTMKDWKSLPTYSTETGDLITNDEAPTQNEFDNCSWAGMSMAQTMAKFGGE